MHFSSVWLKKHITLSLIYITCTNLMYSSAAPNLFYMIPTYSSMPVVINRLWSIYTLNKWRFLSPTGLRRPNKNLDKLYCIFYEHQVISYFIIYPNQQYQITQSGIIIMKTIYHFLHLFPEILRSHSPHTRLRCSTFEFSTTVSFKTKSLSPTT